MSEFFDVVFGFPTVVFTALTLVSLGFWTLTMLFGFADGGDLDIDVDAGTDLGGGSDVGTDVGADAGGGAEGADGADAGSESSDSGGMAGLLQALDLHLLPLTLTVTIVSLVGWLVSAIVTVILTDGQPGALAAVLVGLAAFVAGVTVAGRAGRLLRPIFVPARHVRRRDLIGRLCTVQTGRVDAGFGQAEVIDAERSTHLIQIRCHVDNDLRTGMKALIVDVDDDGRFVVSPDVESLI